MTDKYTFKDIPVCFPWGSDHLEVTNGILDLMNQAYNEGYEQGAKNIKHFKSSPIFDNEHLVIENEKLKEENKELKEQVEFYHTDLEKARYFVIKKLKETKK